MSVATEIGNGHWVAVQPQDYSYQCYQWSGLLATHPCEVFYLQEYIIFATDLNKIGWAKQCLGKDITYYGLVFSFLYR